MSFAMGVSTTLVDETCLVTPCYQAITTMGNFKWTQGDALNEYVPPYVEPEVPKEPNVKIDLGVAEFITDPGCGRDCK